MRYRPENQEKFITNRLKFHLAIVRLRGKEALVWDQGQARRNFRRLIKRYPRIAQRNGWTRDSVNKKPRVNREGNQLSGRNAVSQGREHSSLGVETLEQKTEFGYKASRWVWEDSAAGPVLSHTSHPPYKIIQDRFKTVADLVHWLGHLSEKKWVTKDDLFIVASRFEEANRG